MTKTFRLRQHAYTKVPIYYIEMEYVNDVPDKMGVIGGCSIVAIVYDAVRANQILDFLKQQEEEKENNVIQVEPRSIQE
jgi:hypothetical protein